MTTGRWIVAALATLAVAVVPGALRLAPASPVLERAEPIAAGTARAPWPGSDREVAAVPTLAADPATDVAITPPEELTGALAPVVDSPAPFGGLPGQARPGEVLALSVGIDDYPGSEHDLGFAVADAETIDRALTGFGVPAWNRVVLRDGQARRDQLVASIQALVARAGPGTTVVLAFAGHVRKVDADTEAILTADGATITDRELASLLAPSQAERMWIVLATCYAGGFTEVLAPGRILTGAADASSLAYESSAIEGSYLVHFMVREGWLEGRAGPFVEDAFAYADGRLAQTHPDRRPIQIDYVAGRLRPGPAGQPAPTPPRPAGPPGGGPPKPTPIVPEPNPGCTIAVLCARS